MNIFRAAISAIGVFVVATLTATAQTDDEPGPPERIDPKAMEIAGASAKFLTSRKAMSFNWFVTSDEVVAGREIVTFVRSGSNLLVRGVGFVSRTESGNQVRDYYYDGTTFTVSAPTEGFYASVEFDGGFEKLLVAARERAAMELPLWTLMSETLGETAVLGIEAAAYLGTTLIAGQEAHHLAFSEYDEDWQIWISTDPEKPVPLMIIGTDPYRQGWPQYRVHLLGWEIDPKASGDAFVYTPGDEDVAVTIPALVPTARERQTVGAKDGQSGESSDDEENSSTGDGSE